MTERLPGRKPAGRCAKIPCVTVESVEILSRVPALPGTLLKIPKRETVTDFETSNSERVRHTASDPRSTPFAEIRSEANANNGALTAYTAANTDTVLVAALPEPTAGEAGEEAGHWWRGARRAWPTATKDGRRSQGSGRAIGASGERSRPTAKLLD